MDHHTHHVLFKTHCSCGLLVDDRLDHLNLEKMVARPECAALVVAPFQGAWAYQVRLSIIKPSASFGMFEVALDRRSAPQQIPGAFAHRAAQLFRAEAILAAAPRAGGNF